MNSKKKSLINYQNLIQLNCNDIAKKLDKAKKPMLFYCNIKSVVIAFIFFARKNLINLNLKRGKEREREEIHFDIY